MRNGKKNKSLPWKHLICSHHACHLSALPCQAEALLNKREKILPNHFPFVCVGYELSSRAVSSQVLSPLQRLTSVFGMGTGGPTAFKTLTPDSCRPPLRFHPAVLQLHFLFAACILYYIPIHLSRGFPKFFCFSLRQHRAILTVRRLRLSARQIFRGATRF